MTIGTNRGGLAVRLEDEKLPTYTIVLAPESERIPCPTPISTRLSKSVSLVHPHAGMIVWLMV
jgi:hypothetical protein